MLNEVVRLITRVVCVVLCITLTAGCVAGRISPSSARISDIGKIAVVAVEPPPLLATDATALPGGMLLGGGAMPGAEVLLILGGVIMLISWIASSEKRATANLSDLLAKGLVWSPTRVPAPES